MPIRIGRHDKRRRCVWNDSFWFLSFNATEASWDGKISDSFIAAWRPRINAPPETRWTEFPLASFRKIGVGLVSGLVPSRGGPAFAGLAKHFHNLALRCSSNSIIEQRLAFVPFPPKRAAAITSALSSAPRWARASRVSHRRRLRDGSSAVICAYGRPRGSGRPCKW